MHPKRSAALRALLVAVMSWAIAGCGGGGGEGGGGGGGSGGGGGGGTPATPAPASIVPASPALGETLAADATPFRPLRAGAIWRYRGSSPVAYTSDVSQTDSAAGTVESGTNPLNEGADTQVVRASSGTITATVGGGDTALTFIELRSPIRQNDQYILLESFGVDLGVDFDGDKKNETADIAAYRRVIGVEDVVLPNLPAQRAVRVDTVLLTRAYLSSSGQASDVIEVSRQSTWYVSGIGVVRNRSVDHSSGTDVVTDELLTRWDGLTEGLGYLDPTTPTFPNDGSLIAGLSLPAPYGAVSLADHALVATPMPVLPMSVYGVAMSVLDLRGRVVSTRIHTDLATPLSAGPVRMVQLGSGAGLITPLATDPLSLDLQLYAFDASGARVGSGAPIPIRLGAGLRGEQLDAFSQAIAAPDGSRIWIVWTRRWVDDSAAFVRETLLRQFDTAGNPTTAAFTVSSSGTASFVTTAAAPQSALLGWTVPGGTAWHYGLAQNGGAALSEQPFASAFQPIPFVAPQGQRFGLLWSDAAAVRAVALDGSTLAPTLSAGTGLADQLVSSTWGGSLAGPVSVQADAQRAVIATSVRSQFTPGDSEAPVHVIAELPWSAGPLASAPQAVTRVPDMWPGTTPSGQSLLLFTDRALLLSWNSSTLKVVPVWRR
jgi:hypothetical protein